MAAHDAKKIELLKIGNWEQWRVIHISIFLGMLTETMDHHFMNWHVASMHASTEFNITALNLNKVCSKSSSIRIRTGPYAVHTSVILEHLFHFCSFAFICFIQTVLNV